MKNFFAWLLISSADPNKLALTVKGFLGTVVAVVVMVSPLFHLKVGSEELTQIVDAIVQVIVVVGGVVSAVATLYGAVRKVYLTIHS